MFEMCQQCLHQILLNSLFCQVMVKQLVIKRSFEKLLNLFNQLWLSSLNVVI